MMLKPRLLLSIATCAAGATLLAAQQPTPAPDTPPAQPAQQNDIKLTLSGDAGAPAHYAVPDFIPLTLDVETANAGRAVAEVLWNDLAYEREFDLIPRDTYKTIPQARSTTEVPLDRWRELGADGVVVGSIRKVGNSFQIEMRLYDVRSRNVALGRVYDNISLRNPRAGAHAIADEIHDQQRSLRGVARTKLTFTSDRDGERLTDTVEKRSVKEVYVADYDGANQQRVTANGRLNIVPTWAPDGRSIVYTSYARVVPQILVSNIFLGTRETLTDEKSSNYLAIYSPDGGRIAFMSNRDGQEEIYVMNKDGSNPRRLTNNPASDATPTWSPTGTQIAFTSDRSGSPQIWVMDADGLNVRRLTFSDSWADRATWSPAPFNEIAYAGRTGPGFDIKIYDVASGQTRILTDGLGSNESPAFAPGGRHVAFTSTRAGKVQVFTIARDGKGLKQITFTGNNWTPNWSPR
jgi:TolB protein